MTVKTIRRLAAVLLCLITLTALPAAAFDANAAANELFDACAGGDRAAWMASLSDAAGSGVEWFPLALVRHDPAENVGVFADALAARVTGSPSSDPVARQRMALTLVALGRGDHPFVTDTLDDAGTRGVMSEIFGLILTDAVGGDPAALTEALLGRVLSDGGWALTGDRADADVTAMALTALSPHRDDTAVAAAVEGGLALLSDRQRPDGGFESYGVANAESAAQVILALTSLGRDPLTDPAFQKDGRSPVDALLSFFGDDGTVSHEAGGPADTNAAMQALCALTALERYQSGAPAFYDFSDLAPTGASPSASSVAEAPAAPGPIRSHPVRAALLGVLLIALAVVCLISRHRRRPARDRILFLIAAAVIAAVILFLPVTPADEFYGVTGTVTDPVGSVTLSVRCDRAIAVMTADWLPADGVMLAPVSVPFAEGDTAFDVLARTAREAGLPLSVSGDLASDAGAAYLSAIGYLEEFACGDLSGWVYRVNGQRPSVGCGRYALSDGDTVEFLYSCDLGNDLDG